MPLNRRYCHIVYNQQLTCPYFHLTVGQTCPTMSDTSTHVYRVIIPVSLGRSPLGLGYGYPSSGVGLPFHRGKPPLRLLQVPPTNGWILCKPNRLWSNALQPLSQSSYVPPLSSGNRDNLAAIAAIKLCLLSPDIHLIIKQLTNLAAIAAIILQK